MLLSVQIGQKATGVTRESTCTVPRLNLSIMTQCEVADCRATRLHRLIADVQTIACSFVMEGRATA